MYAFAAALALTGAAAWYFTRETVKKTEPTAFDKAKASGWNWLIWLWNGMQVLFYFLLTTAIGAFLVLMVVGGPLPNVLIFHELAGPWSGWWLPQAIAGIAVLPLLATEKLVFQWAFADKNTKAALKQIKDATEMIAHLIFGLTVYVLGSTAIAMIVWTTNWAVRTFEQLTS